MNPTNTDTNTSTNEETQSTDIPITLQPTHYPELSDTREVVARRLFYSRVHIAR